jgi:hypothetical protein
MKAPESAKLFDGLPLPNQPQRQQVLAVLHPAAGLDREIALRANAVSRWLPNYLGWHWAIDGGRVTSVEQLLRIAFKVINR